MPLPLIETRDPTVFLQAIKNTVLVPATTTSIPQIGLGWILRDSMAKDDGQGYRGPAYDFVNDRMFWFLIDRTTNPGQQSIRAGALVFDALAVNSTAARNGFADQLTLGLVPYSNMGLGISGQPRLETNSQTMYALGGSSGISLFDLDSVSLGPTTIFPNIGLDGGSFNRSAESNGSLNGFYVGNLNANDSDAVLFEGIVSSVGMSDVSLGGSAHAEGLALVKCQNANITSPNSHDKAWIWVDLDTGDAVGFFDIPSITDVGAFVGSEPRVDGQEFEWRRGQYVPDPGTSYGAPKGEFHCYSNDNDGRIDVPIASTGGTGRRHYVRAYDFNPFNVAAGANRIHGRTIFTGIIDIPTDPIITGGQNLANNDESVSIYYHQASRAYFCWNGISDNLVGNLNETPEPGDWVIHRWRRTFVPDEVISVTPLSEVTENSLIRYEGKVLTDLQEPAGGVSVAVTLQRVSTRDENFDGTAQGSGNYSVDRAVIDESGLLEVRQGGGIDSGGTLLVLSVDYTVSSFETGTIAPVGSWPTAQIHVRYRHLEVPTGTGHGSLLTNQTTTDSDGSAEALVDYGDNTEGEWDRVDFTAS